MMLLGGCGRIFILIFVSSRLGVNRHLGCEEVPNVVCRRRGFDKFNRSLGDSNSCSNGKDSRTPDPQRGVLSECRIILKHIMYMAHVSGEENSGLTAYKVDT